MFDTTVRESPGKHFGQDLCQTTCGHTSSWSRLVVSDICLFAEAAPSPLGPLVPANVFLSLKEFWLSGFILPSVISICLLPFTAEPTSLYCHDRN